MPKPMADSINSLNDKEKFYIFVSCLNSKYVREWQNCYENIAQFIHLIYRERDTKYRIIGDTENDMLHIDKQTKITSFFSPD
jgi:hypothetical protein